MKHFRGNVCLFLLLLTGVAGAENEEQFRAGSNQSNHDTAERKVVGYSSGKKGASGPTNKSTKSIHFHPTYSP